MPDLLDLNIDLGTFETTRSYKSLKLFSLSNITFVRNTVYMGQHLFSP